MTIGSLFSGIGGLELGLESLGLGPVIWQCDSDPCARAVLEHHWPGVKRYDDVKEIDGTATRPDILCGGFPCQDISNAGKRAGITGERSGLWSEYARIIGELRPGLVFIENVAALRTRGLDRVLSDLAALGYDATWGDFSAAEVGAPHRRARLFILAHPHGSPRGWARDAVTGAGDEAIRGRAPESGRRCLSVAHADGAGLALGSLEPARGECAATERGSAPANPWAVEPDVGRVAHGVPARMDRLRLLGNACVPQQAAHAFKALIERATS